MSVLIGCCCGCEEYVNFKAFNFADGELLWQKLLGSIPMLGIDGKVWCIESTVLESTQAFEITSGTQSLPARTADGLSASNTITVKSARGYATDGTLSVTGADMISASVSTHLTYSGTGPAFRPGQFQVDANGVASESLLGSSIGGVGVAISENKTGQPVTYFFYGYGMHDADVTFTCASGSAVVSIQDSAASVQTALAGMGASVSSVTCSGDSARDRFMTIEITWASDSDYLQSFAVNIATRVDLGGCWTRNLSTGKVLNGATGVMANTSTYAKTGIWITTNKLLTVGQYNTGAGPAPSVEIWDTSSHPFSLDYRDAYSSGHSTTISSESKIRKYFIAHHSKIAVGVARMGATPFSLLVYNDDGTGKATYDRDYAPLSICFSDAGATETMILASDWSHAQQCSSTSTGCTTIDYRSYDGAPQQILDSGFNTSEYLNAGVGLTARSLFGFDSTGVAAIMNQSKFHSGTENESVTYTTQDFTHVPNALTNFVDITLPTRCNEVGYLLMTEFGYLPETYEWRLNWSVLGDATDWLDETAVLSDLNTALFNLWGNDVEGNQNAVASSWNTPPTYLPGMEPPIFAQYIAVDVRFARNSAEAASSGMPMGASSTTLGVVSPCTLEVRSETLRRTADITVLKRSDGGVLWKRGWRETRDYNYPTASPFTGCLHDGILYVYGTEVCAEEITGTPIIIVEPPEEPP